MSYNKNIFSGHFIEFHILQSFPTTCLNRDENNSPKTAIIGDSIRALVTSQCWKRPVRLGLHDLGLTLATRTKLIGSLITNECKKLGASDEQANICGEKIEHIFIKEDKNSKDNDLEKTSKKKKDIDSEEESKSDNEKSDTLLFLSPSEITKLAIAFKEKDFNPEEVIKNKNPKKRPKEVSDIIGKPNYTIDGADIALFGRMVAQAASLDVQGSIHFADAISTHKISNQFDFFTALDDLNDEKGAAHMGTTEFNSATYYRYISIDLGQLYENLAGTNTVEVVNAFIKSLFLAIPTAKQTTKSGASRWDFAKMYVRKSQPIQASFETPIKSKNGGFLEPSIQYLKDFLNKKEKLDGSLFGKILSKEFGEDENYSFDNLIEDITNFMKDKINAN